MRQTADERILFMKFNWKEDKYVRIALLAFGVIALSILFYCAVFHMGTILDGIGNVISVMAPIIYGFTIAYLLNPITAYCESKIFYRIYEKRSLELTDKRKRMARWLSSLVTCVIFVLLIYGLFNMVIPSLISSIMKIVENLPGYITTVREWVINFLKKRGGSEAEVVVNVDAYFDKASEYLQTNLMPQMQNILSNVTGYLGDAFSLVKDFVVGIIVSVYMLVDKEVFIGRTKMFLYAVLPADFCNKLMRGMRFADKRFGGFINGKLWDSAIIGVLCYIGMLLMDLPYALSISVIIGVTNIIPFFGPFIGAIPSFLLILLENPIQSIYFLIFILILQQFDGNILGPKILGDSTGLSSFMVIVAILIGGAMFGVIGMIIGVPLCACIYSVFWNLIGKRLEERELSSDYNDYEKADHMETETNTLIPIEKEDVKPRTIKLNPNGFFAKLFVRIWVLLVQIIQFVWAYIKKALYYVGKGLKFAKEWVVQFFKSLKKTDK